jgi:type I restriction enzyme S subunit
MNAMAAERDDAESADEPWPLPEGWVWAPLAPFLANGQVTIDPRREPERTFILYSVPSFEKHMPDRVRGAEVFSPKRQVQPGSVLLCKINPRINRAWVVSDHKGQEIIASPEWITFPYSEALEPHYLRYFLSTERVRQYLSQNVSGVGGSLMRVNSSTVGEIRIPVAPLYEQRRIVACIDELFDEIAEGEVALERARSGLDIWRRALLKAAVTGELTRDWRKENRPDENGADLLASIRAKREVANSKFGRGRRVSNAEPFDVAALRLCQKVGYGRQLAKCLRFIPVRHLRDLSPLFGAVISLGLVAGKSHFAE